MLILKYFYFVLICCPSSNCLVYSRRIFSLQTLDISSCSCNFLDYFEVKGLCKLTLYWCICMSLKACLSVNYYHVYLSLFLCIIWTIWLFVNNKLTCLQQLSKLSKFYYSSTRECLTLVCWFCLKSWFISVKRINWGHLMIIFIILVVCLRCFVPLQCRSSVYLILCFRFGL